MPFPNELSAPPLDAEKTGTEQLLENFQWPPDLDRELTRSTLLVGTRGSGKTMYLRRSRHKMHGLAIYGDLRKVLNPLTSDIGVAGLSFKEIPASQEQFLRAKTIALIAHWVFSKVVDAGVELDTLTLERVLPTQCLNVRRVANVSLNALREALETAPLPAFRDGPRQSAFDDFLEYIGEKVKGSSERLIILLDRAEEVPYPGLSPVMQLLDQRHEFLAIIATRPGILGPNHQMSPDVPIPGDHYNLRHLGASPYCSEWRTFVSDVLGVWLPRSTTCVPDEEFNWLLSVARDSLRNALELLYNALDRDNHYSPRRARRQLALIRDTQLKAAQGQMRRLNGDLSALIRKVRQRAGTEIMMLPVALSVRSMKQGSLFAGPKHPRDMTRDEQAICLGLRTGFFTTLDGVVWHPFSKVDTFEIPPLFVWEEGDTWSSM